MNEVPPSEDVPAVVAMRQDMARWFRDLADRAERGEFVAAAVALVKVGMYTSSAWHDQAGNGTILLGSIQSLSYRLSRGLFEGAEDA